ncbi:MAG: RNA 2',3'-cyclic phosphodiesterase [Patescibacteria group bacterium]
MRCFLGIPIPADCREQLRNAWQVPQQERAILKLSDPGQWHITLAFFGEIEQKQLLELSHLIGSALETPPQGAFKITGIESFPAKRPIRYVAICEPEQKAAWQDTVANIVDMTSLMAPQIDRKPWLPHITIARARNNKTLEPFEMSIENIGWVPDFATLYMSELSPSGPKYTALHDYRLNI